VGADHQQVRTPLRGLSHQSPVRRVAGSRSLDPPAGKRVTDPRRPLLPQLPRVVHGLAGQLPRPPYGQRGVFLLEGMGWLKAGRRQVREDLRRRHDEGFRVRGQPRARQVRIGVVGARRAVVTDKDFHVAPPNSYQYVP
jgi:hypothetical protein